MRAMSEHNFEIKFFKFIYVQDSYSNWKIKSYIFVMLCYTSLKGIGVGPATDCASTLRTV